MASQQNSLATVDTRPFFERAIAFGVGQGILDTVHLNRLRDDGPKGVVQIANHFGTAHLHASLETAAARMVNLISLYLEEHSNANLMVAAGSLRDNTLLSHSRGGSEMLKRLNALPQDTLLIKRQANPAEEKAFIDEKSFASPLSLADYRAELAHRQALQRQLDFARWVAGQLQANSEDYLGYSAEQLIASAMLVWHVGLEPLAFPTRAEFVKLINQIRKPSFKPQTGAYEKMLRAAPEDFRLMAEQAMQNFVKAGLPELRSKACKPVDFIHGDQGGRYFIQESLEADVGEYDKLVAAEWVRLTKGRSDPATIFTLFLFMATGLEPKASMLQKEGRAIIEIFRRDGFQSDKVCAFISEFAPHEQRGELTEMWLEDLRPEAEIHLADPDRDDTYMERALRYLQRSCAASWKGRS